MIVLFVLAAALASGIDDAHAAVYKWIDENGVTQYSEKPPPGRKAAEIPTPPPRPAPAQAAPANGAAASKTWQEKEAEFRQRRAAEAEARMQREEERRAKAPERRRACLDAQHDMHALQSGRRIYSINEKGERIYMEDKDREQFRQRLQQAIKENCESS